MVIATSIAVLSYVGLLITEQVPGRFLMRISSCGDMDLSELLSSPQKSLTRWKVNAETFLRKC